MRDDVIAALAERVMTDESFRQGAREDLEGTLRGAGFELEDDEMEAVRGLHAEYLGASDDDLVDGLRRQGGNG